MANIISGYKVEYGVGASVNTEPSSYTELKECVKSLPNFFTEPDTVDVTTVDMTQKATIAGMQGGEAYSFTVLPNAAFLTAHAAMVTAQTGTVGEFWLKVTVTNRGKVYKGRFTTVNMLPTPEGEAGEADSISVPFYNKSDITVEEAD